MTAHRAFVFRLKPTAPQEAQFRAFSGVCRLVYNLALEQRRDHWRAFKRAAGRHISYVSQARELTELRALYDFIKDVSQTCQQQALRDLDKAYKNFFAGRAGYPRPRKRGINDAFRFQGREIETQKLNRNWSAVRLPKIGWVKYRHTRELPEGKLLNVTVTARADGWHIALAMEVEAAIDVRGCGAIGIDRGVAIPIQLSNGERYTAPNGLAQAQNSIRKLQRKAARRQRGSNRWHKTMRRVRRLKARQANIRRHAQHIASTDIARRFDEVAIEKQRTTSMTRSAKGTIEEPGRNVKAKAGLNRAILNVGWAGFVAKLAYKLEARSGYLIEVDPKHTSQTCSSCSHVDHQSRKNQARFECTACGTTMNADVNAAINILNRGLNRASSGVEDRGSPAGETLTHRKVA